MTTSLYARLAARFPDPSKVFLETHDGRTITYGDLDAESARMAGALMKLGVKPGDRVAVQVQKSAEALLLYLGCLRAGAVYLPLNTAYTLAELGYFIGDAEPTVVVCDPAVREAVAALPEAKGVAAVETLDSAGRGTMADKAAGQFDTFADVDRAGDDLAAILYTSGTTGRSKGAMLTQDNLASNAEVLVDAWRFTAADVLIHALPIYHTHGLFVATNTLLMAGGTMLFLPKFDADAVLALMPRATTMMGVPTFYTRLIDHPGLTREVTKTMRLFTSGSAPLLAETHRAFEERTGHRILERYGMTETNMSTSNPYEGERRAGTVGFPLPGVDLRIVDPDSGSELPQGEIGIIEVKGPNVFKGYWRMPEKTQAEFRPDGFFITGDVAMVDADGYVHIVGRAKDLIISGGFNVYPKEVESEIDAMEGVVESAVIGLPHRDFGEGVTAVVVLETGAALPEEHVQAQLKQRLAAYKLPKRVFFVDALPRNTMGKVQKNVLRDTYAKTYEG
ncbi:malonate--CoA ligase [Microbaculum marinisediminis]|uniref:3-methylmercaptopropionyl-CoA ligase n=1 Tax=Microbaculum marinisediminis TaxID=2931392 RepID=A0AAW5R8P5_9HYPH|nr:malonyl-CoA synthase [Microbaculum sp. A6E488]MCT8974896.1 malonyl-CoA synthase [Microbaculum sp. A6E488]